MFENRINAQLKDASIFRDEDGLYLSLIYKDAQFEGEKRDVYIPKVRLPIPVSCLPTIQFGSDGNEEICQMELDSKTDWFHLDVEPCDGVIIKSTLGVEVDLSGKFVAEVRQEKVLSEEEALAALKEHFGCPVVVRSRSE